MTDLRTFASLRLAVILTVGMTLTVGCSSSEEPVDVDGKYDTFLNEWDGRADVPDTIHEGSPEARAILGVVNSKSRHQLVSEASLYWRSAVNIIDYRAGEDGRLHTKDDRVIFTLAELDSIYYVGESAFRRLRSYVHDNDLVVYDLEVEEGIPERISTARTAHFKGEIGAGEIIEVPMSGALGDRILLSLRKADSAKWNPRLAIEDAETGQSLVSANPWGTADARIPSRTEDLDQGFMLDREGTDFTVILHNTNSVEGSFEFSMECVGGPCYDFEGEEVDSRPLEDLFDEELERRMISDHMMNHVRFTYRDARLEMFSNLDNVDGEVQCVYTGAVIETNTIPSNLEMNAEHTWPQSLGAFDGAARSDLHHIYPVTSVVNSLRANHPFCVVDYVVREMDEATLGYDGDGRRCFEPRDQHKGDLARAIFYFAVVYQQDLEDGEEEVLRKWAVEDPVDAHERLRSQKISVFQGSTQPFVESPQLIDHIADF